MKKIRKFFLNSGEEAPPNKADYAVEIEFAEDGRVVSSTIFYAKKKESNQG